MTYDLRLMTYDLRLTTYDLRLTTYDLRFTTRARATHDSRLTTHDSRLATGDSRLARSGCALLLGESLLKIEVMDADFLPMMDDLIGYTEIDLEDRLLSKWWHDTVAKHGGKPPLEERQLKSPLSSVTQGRWADG